MNVATQTAPVQQANIRGNQPTFVKKTLAERIEALTTVTAYALWQPVMADIVKGDFTANRQAMALFIEKCPNYFVEPGRNLRLDLLKKYQDYILDGVKAENIGTWVWHLVAYVEMSSRLRAGEYLKAMTLVVLMYKEVRMPIPAALSTAMIKCVRVHKEDGAFTPAELVYAGYEKCVVDKRRAYVHPVTQDTFTFEKLSGVETMSEEQIAKAQAANAALRAQGKAARVKVVVKTPKVDKKAKKKEAEAAKNKRK